VVEHLPRHPEVKGLSPAAGNGRENGESIARVFSDKHSSLSCRSVSDEETRPLE